MRVIARGTLVAFWTRHPDAEASLRHWYGVSAAAEWTSAHAVVADFSKAKALSGDRVRFEVAGGKYRLIVAFDWARGIAFVKFVGTHTAYDAIDALTVTLF